MQLIRVIKKLKGILSLHQKFRIIELGIMMFIGGVLETISVSLILPFMSLVLNPEETMNRPYISVVCSLLDIQSAKQFLIIVAISIALLYVIKNAYLLFEYNVQYRFVTGNARQIQLRLLSCLINRPYEYFLGINSGEIVRIVNTDAISGFGLLMTLLGFFTELVVSSMLVITVFVITPIISAIMAGVLLISVFVINRVLRPKLENATKQVQISGTGENKWLLQSIHGIKEIKVMQKEQYFLDKYGYYRYDSILATRKRDVLSILPKYFLEAVSMSAIFLTIAILISVNIELQLLVPAISAIAVASIRLLPSVNKMSTMLATLSANEPMLDTLIENIDMIQEMGIHISQGELNADNFLSENTQEKQDERVDRFRESVDFSHITYRYPQGETDVLSDASVTIHKGETIGIVGASGAGKTTTVDILLGLLRPQEGTIFVDGSDITNDMAGWLRQIGYIPQMIFMLDDTIRNNIAFGDPEVTDDRVWEALKEASLDEFVKSLPKGLDTEIGERGIRLSGGQRQRIGIARALYTDPAILFFDEATSALDNETESAIMESINHFRGTKTMVIIAHRLTTIENCDHVYRVKDGRIQLER